jgi:DNA mismatch endonuclease, patch repair protein
MTDILTPEQRRLNMSRIRGRDTKPEMLIRRGLHSRGLRYRLHDRSLPGRPDLVFPKYRTAVFVHGCFWHEHGCLLSKVPRTREEFWRDKLTRNVIRDKLAIHRLRQEGWRVLVVWECAFRGSWALEVASVLDQAAEYVRNGSGDYLELAGRSQVESVLER